MNWTRMDQQKPPIGTPMLALNKDRSFSSGTFSEMSQGDTAYQLFFKGNSGGSGYWTSEYITHWALVELPE